VADFETKLQLLSERGTPVGAEELIERIEAELAGDPLVVVYKQREGALMTKTDQRVTTKGPGTGRGLVWAVAAFAVILAVGGLYLAFSGDRDEVADTTPDTETMTDLEIIEAGVAALYSGDADRAVELFQLKSHIPELADQEDEWIREEAAYQAAIDGRATMDCNEKDTPGMFTCTWIYRNAFTDAIGYVERRVDTVPGRHVYGDTVLVVVDDGVITEFSEFPFFNAALNMWLEDFLGQGGESPENSDSLCNSQTVKVSLECVDFALDHLDEWAAWAKPHVGP
jgi:hypothetical protein